MTGPHHALASALAAAFLAGPWTERAMTDAGRQRVCGVLVNRRTNVAREEYDALKAILHNAAVTGPDTQNRKRRPDFRAVLAGRVAGAASLHPQRGEELRRRLDRVRWD